MTNAKIHLPSYPRGIHQIHEALTAQELSLDPLVFTGPIDINVRLDRHDPYLEFDIKLQSQAAAECDRCLTSFSCMLAASSPMLCVLSREPSGESVDDPGISYLPPHTTDVDLTNDIRDLLILSMPGKYLCREDCRGLCPGCGADLNVQECTCGLSR